MMQYCILARMPDHHALPTVTLHYRANANALSRLGENIRSEAAPISAGGALIGSF
jgi:hypothetical protein